jgi:enoyl-CoA hydratase
MSTEKKIPSYTPIFENYEHILYEKDGYVANITLNRPEKRNPLDRAVTIPELNDALSVAEWDDDVKVIVFKGAGPAFCGGYDLSEVGFMYGMKEPKSGETVRRPSQRIRLMQDRYMHGEFLRHVLYCQKATIAQTHGFCLGGGLMLAEKCDLILGAEDCKYGFVEERLGLGGHTMSPTLILRVGLTKALELLMTGKMIDGKEAERISLINRAVPADKLETEVKELANGIALHSRDGLAIAKATRHAVYESMGLGQWFNTAYWSHTLITNMQWESDELNFFKQRRDKGVTEAAHEKQAYYKALDR